MPNSPKSGTTFSRNVWCTGCSQWVLFVCSRCSIQGPFSCKRYSPQNDLSRKGRILSKSLHVQGDTGRWSNTVSRTLYPSTLPPSLLSLSLVAFPREVEKGSASSRGILAKASGLAITQQSYVLPIALTQSVTAAWNILSSRPVSCVHEFTLQPKGQP